MKPNTHNNLIYFDNAATSWPKPPGVAEAMCHFLSDIGANPGRSGHQLAVKSSRLVYDVREKICKLFNASDPLRVVFAKNVTEVMNLVLCGLLKPGDHVITSGMEHNAVMRPLRFLEANNIQLTVVSCSRDGQLDPQKITSAIRGNTRLVVINHASNVTGTLLPVTEIGQICQENELLFLVDTAQTAGAIPIDMAAEKIDLLAFTGHKSLLGPMGTGGLILGNRVKPNQIAPLIRGGTGSRSEKEIQPEFLPDVFESGTQNAVGLAGLGASVGWILDKGVKRIRQHENELITHLLEGLHGISKVFVYGTQDPQKQTGTISFNLAHMAPSELGFRLDEDFGILSRVGLHCAPAAHKTIGTFPAGNVRFGLGVFNTHDEVESGIAAIQQLAKELP